MKKQEKAQIKPKQTPLQSPRDPSEKNAIKVRYDTGSIYLPNYWSNVIWKCGRCLMGYRCPVCNNLLPQAALNAYLAGSKEGEYPAIGCYHCRSLLGLRGLDFDKDLYLSSLITEAKHNKEEGIQALKEEKDTTCQSFTTDTLIITKLHKDQIEGSTLWSNYLLWTIEQQDTKPLRRNAFYTEMDKILGKRDRYKYTGVRLRTSRDTKLL